MTADRAKPRANLGHERTEKWLLPGALVLVVAAVLMSPLLMVHLSSKGLPWQQLADIGQAYGGASALLSAAALCGVVASLLFQRRQVRQELAEMDRQQHIELMRIALEHPDGKHALSAPKARDRDGHIHRGGRRVVRRRRSVFPRWPATSQSRLSRPDLTSSMNAFHAPSVKTSTPPDGFFESLTSTRVLKHSSTATSMHALLATERELLNHALRIANTPIAGRYPEIRMQTHAMIVLTRSKAAKRADRQVAGRACRPLWKIRHFRKIVATVHPSRAGRFVAAGARRTPPFDAPSLAALTLYRLLG